MKIPIPTGLPIIDQVRIENTNSCGYKCTFCPREKMDRKQGIQTVEDFALVLDRVEEYIGKKYEGPLHLHGYGEPLLDKHLPAKIKLSHKKWPNANAEIISTLGYNLSEEYLKSLVDAGLNKIIVSFYGSDKSTYNGYAGSDRFDTAYKNLKFLCEYSKTKTQKMKIQVQTYISGLNYTIDQPNKKTFVEEISKLGVVVHNAWLHNYGDGRNFLKSKKLLCERAIKRNILQVTWDLNVIPCCFDYNAEEKLGNLRTMSLKEIFMAEKSMNFLADHCNENVDKYRICANCTMRSKKKID